MADQTNSSQMGNDGKGKNKDEDSGFREVEAEETELVSSDGNPARDEADLTQGAEDPRSADQTKRRQ